MEEINKMLDVMDYAGIKLEALVTQVKGNDANIVRQRIGRIREHLNYLIIKICIGSV